MNAEILWSSKVANMVFYSLLISKFLTVSKSSQNCQFYFIPNSRWLGSFLVYHLSVTICQFWFIFDTSAKTFWAKNSQKLDKICNFSKFLAEYVEICEKYAKHLKYVICLKSVQNMWKIFFEYSHKNPGSKNDITNLSLVWL